jgi:hypothetical protein
MIPTSNLVPESRHWSTVAVFKHEKESTYQRPVRLLIADIFEIRKHACHGSKEIELPLP